MPNALNFTKKLFSANNILSIEPINRFTKKHKIVVFVPQNRVDELTFAMSEAGAGKIGEYSICSFRIPGEGTFKGSNDSKPFIGKKDNFEKVEEIRLEMICESDVLDSAISEMLRVHPYEEPAYEIYEVVTGEKVSSDKAVKVSLKDSISVKELIIKLNKKIETTLLSSKSLNKKFKNFIVDFTGKKGSFEINKHISTGTLHITPARTGEYNISFNNKLE